MIKDWRFKAKDRTEDFMSMNQPVKFDYLQDQGLNVQGQGQNQGLDFQGRGQDQRLRFCP